MATTRNRDARSAPDDRPTEPGRRGGRRGRRAARAVGRTVLGDKRRIGLWALPLFLMVGLLGATLAGGLAVLYYGQQVGELREATGAARTRLQDAAEDVERTAEEAKAAIEEQVRQVRESLARGLPVANPNEAGVYAVAAAHGDGEVRVGSAFTVYSDRQETYLVTSYRLVETLDGFAVEGAEVHLPEQVLTARVHSFDPDRELALLLLAGGPLPVLDWRPGAEGVGRGDAIYLAAVAGPDTAAVAEGRVVAVGRDAIVTTHLVNSFTDGGPLLDGEGRVVAVASLRYQPYGPVDGNQSYAVPIREICRTLIRCTDEDLGGAPPAPDRAPAPRSQQPAPEPPNDDLQPEDDAAEPPAEDPGTPPPEDPGTPPPEDPGTPPADGPPEQP